MYTNTLIKDIHEIWVIFWNWEIFFWWSSGLHICFSLFHLNFHVRNSWGEQILIRCRWKGVFVGVYICVRMCIRKYAWVYTGQWLYVLVYTFANAYWYNHQIIHHHTYHCWRSQGPTVSGRSFEWYWLIPTPLALTRLGSWQTEKPTRRSVGRRFPRQARTCISLYNRVVSRSHKRGHLLKTTGRGDPSHYKSSSWSVISSEGLPSLVIMTHVLPFRNDGLFGFHEWLFEISWAVSCYMICAADDRPTYNACVWLSLLTSIKCPEIRRIPTE